MTTEKPTTSIVSITPEVAERWLGKNVQNRGLKRIVNEYARDMTAGRWKLTGESIKFSADGILLDGQHRLYAVIASGVTVQMFVTRGLSGDAQSVMDTGSKRTAGDALQIQGEKYAAMLAAVARLSMSLEAGRTISVTHSEIRDYIDTHPTIRYACENLPGKVASKTGISPSIVAFTFWRFVEIDPEGAYCFWNDAAEKVGLRRGDPVIAMVDRFAAAARTREAIPKREQVAMIFRTWNHRRAGGSTSKAKIMRGSYDLPTLK